MRKKATRGRQKPDFSVRIKVWIENENHELVIGIGRVVMLEAIERTGSINQAARELQMSYRALWGRLLETEARLGRKLLIRQQGGANGGGSRLSPLAVSLVKQFREFESRLAQDAKEIFQASDLNFLNPKSE